jgi:hypothetical protein
MAETSAATELTTESLREFAIEISKKSRLEKPLTIILGWFDYDAFIESLPLNNSSILMLHSLWKELSRCSHQYLEEDIVRSLVSFHRPQPRFVYDKVIMSLEDVTSIYYLLHIAPTIQWVRRYCGSIINVSKIGVDRHFDQLRAIRIAINCNRAPIDYSRGVRCDVIIGNQWVKSLDLKCTWINFTESLLTCVNPNMPVRLEFPGETNLTVEIMGISHNTGSRRQLMEQCINSPPDYFSLGFRLL